MDILDLMAQMEQYGTLVAFAPHWKDSYKTVVIVKLDEPDKNDNEYYVLIWNDVDRTHKIWHSSATWTTASISFGNLKK